MSKITFAEDAWEECLYWPLQDKKDIEEEYTMFTPITLTGRVTADLELQTSQNNTEYVQFNAPCPASKIRCPLCKQLIFRHAHVYRKPKLRKNPVLNDAHCLLWLSE